MTTPTVVQFFVGGKLDSACSSYVGPKGLMARVTGDKHTVLLGKDDVIILSLMGKETTVARSRLTIRCLAQAIPQFIDELPTEFSLDISDS